MNGPTAAPAIVMEAFTALLKGERAPWQLLGVSRNGVLEACTAEELTGLLHERLRACEESGWPPELCADLTRHARTEAARELVRRQELVTVLNALAAQQIHPILLKGTALAYGVYSAPASRLRHDTDLLIRRDEVDAVRQVMIRLGYTPPVYCDGELLFCQFALARDDEFGLSHVFDFHWKISTQSVFAGLVTHAEMTADAVPVPALGPHGRAAGPMHALLLACVHPVMHHRNIERLVWIYDIHLLASRLTDSQLERFADFAVARRVGAICLHELVIAQQRFGTRIPGRAALKLASARDEASAAYLRHGRRWHDEVVSSLQGLRGWKARLRFMREVLFPGPRYMLGAYGVRSAAIGFALLPALYVHRNMRGMVKVLVGRK